MQIYAVRSLRTVTFVSEFPYRKIQIVLRLYKTLAEVLHGFDVDACSIGFDGHTVCTNDVHKFARIATRTNHHYCY